MSKNNFFKREAKRENCCMRKPEGRKVPFSKKTCHAGRHDLSSKRNYSQTKRSVEKVMSPSAQKHDEFNKLHMALQFYYFLAQLDILNYIGKDEARLLLTASTDKARYNTHHILPLRLNGTNEFENLSVINKQLHKFINIYCLPDKAVDYIAKLPTQEEKKALLDQFVPSFAPVARTEDFLCRAVVCAVRSGIFFAQENDLKSGKRPLRFYNLTKMFSSHTLEICNLSEDILNRLVDLSISHKLEQDPDKKEELKKEINLVEEEIIAPERKKEPDLAELRRKFDRTRLQENSVWHQHALDLIECEGVAPIRILTPDRIQNYWDELIRKSQEKLR